MLFLVRLGAGIIAARLGFANLQVELVLLVAAHVRVRHVVQRVAENIAIISFILSIVIMHHIYSTKKFSPDAHFL
jgi:hypothetical protein